jgi:hypothetical protein
VRKYARLCWRGLSDERCNVEEDLSVVYHMSAMGVNRPSGIETVYLLGDNVRYRSPLGFANRLTGEEFNSMSSVTQPRAGGSDYAEV